VAITRGIPGDDGAKKSPAFASRTMRKTEGFAGAVLSSSRRRKRRSASHPVVGATVFAPNRGDNEWQKAGLLTSRSSYSPRLTAVAGSQSGPCQQWQTIMGLSSLVTAAQPPGISPAQPAPAAPSSLFSCSRSLQALFAHIHNILWVNQRTTLDVVVLIWDVEGKFFRNVASKGVPVRDFARGPTLQVIVLRIILGWDREPPCEPEGFPAISRRLTEERATPPDPVRQRRTPKGVAALIPGPRFRKSTKCRRAAIPSG
jgi:hypothetical protein